MYGSPGANTVRDQTIPDETNTLVHKSRPDLNTTEG